MRIGERGSGRQTRIHNGRFFGAPCPRRKGRTKNGCIPPGFQGGVKFELTSKFAHADGGATTAAAVRPSTTSPSFVRVFIALPLHLFWGQMSRLQPSAKCRPAKKCSYHPALTGIPSVNAAMNVLMLDLDHEAPLRPLRLSGEFSLPHYQAALMWALFIKM